MGLTIFLVLVAGVGAAVYYFVFLSEAPEVARERFGELEAPPADLGEWHRDADSPAAAAAAAAGLDREERLFEDTLGGFGAGRLVRQARLRDRATGEIVRVEPDVVVRRRRVRG
jgi:hypothetical protein